jgi:YbgC/YbaW family acyl-CoA thioester hydrolase
MNSSPVERLPCSGFRFSHRLRVRWSEVDLQKIVFNAHYLTYVDTAMADYWRAMALPYEDAMRQLGGELFVRKATLEFEASAVYDDVLNVALRFVRAGTSSLVFEAAIFRDAQRLVGCDLVYVFADPASLATQPVPASLRDALARFESGQAMTRITLGSWPESGADASAVRSEVFIAEQGIPQEMEWDEADALCLHAVAYNPLGQPVGTARLLPSDRGSAKIGRMAVKRVLRGTAIGRQLLHALVAAAWERGDLAIVLHAQQSARRFYEKSGFVVQGAPFEEVGIPHIEMALTNSQQGRRSVDSA